MIMWLKIIELNQRALALEIAPSTLYGKLKVHLDKGKVRVCDRSQKKKLKMKKNEVMVWNLIMIILS